MSRLLIYGANGYTGHLIARVARQRGVEPAPILAGRSADKVGAIARELGFDQRIFGLDDPAAVRAGLADVDVVVHCAGPFSRTSKPMVDACLATGTHYLDITGEMAVFEEVAKRDADAKEAGVMLLPGAGFDVVPTDCTAVFLKGKLPSATHLELAFNRLGGGVSHGTATTAVENLHMGNYVRRSGVLTPDDQVRTRRIDYGEPGEKLSVAIPWGDVSTAWHSTEIPNITVWMPATRAMILGMKAARKAGRLLSSAPFQKAVKKLVDMRPAGPTDAERARGTTFIWGEARDERSGQRVESRLKTPEGYTLTADAALHIAGKVLAGDHPPGFQTPGKAYGADLVLELPGVTRRRP